MEAPKIKDFRCDQIEQVIVATLLVNGEKFDLIKGKIHPGMFYKYSYQKIVQAMFSAHEKGVGIDTVTVWNEDKQINLAEMTEVITELPANSWADSTFTGNNLDSYIRILQDTSSKRELYTKLTQGNDLNIVLDDLRKMENLGKDRVYNLKEWVESVYNSLENTSSDMIAEYGIPYLDKATGGVKKGQLIVIAARPSVGKSTLLQNIAVNAYKGSKKVFFATAEMSAEMIGKRIIAQLSGKNVFMGEKIDREELKLLLNNEFFIIHQLTTIGELETRLKENRENIDIVFIDYMQLLEPKGKYKNIYEKITLVSNELAQLKNKFNIPVVVASQYSRSAQKQQPTMSDLRESGAIEQDADVIISLWRKNSDYSTSTKQKVRLDILKNRNGPVMLNSSMFDYYLHLDNRRFFFYQEVKEEEREDDKPPL